MFIGNFGRQSGAARFIRPMDLCQVEAALLNNRFSNGPSMVTGRAGERPRLNTTPEFLLSFCLPKNWECPSMIARVPPANTIFQLNPRFFSLQFVDRRVEAPFSSSRWC